jgi:hypothetical protein
MYRRQYKTVIPKSPGGFFGALVGYAFKIENKQAPKEANIIRFFNMHL